MASGDSPLKEKQFVIDLGITVGDCPLQVRYGIRAFDPETALIQSGIRLAKRHGNGQITVQAVAIKIDKRPTLKSR